MALVEQLGDGICRYAFIYLTFFSFLFFFLSSLDCFCPLVFNQSAYDWC